MFSELIFYFFKNVLYEPLLEHFDLGQKLGDGGLLAELDRLHALIRTRQPQNRLQIQQNILIKF